MSPLAAALGSNMAPREEQSEAIVGVKYIKHSSAPYKVFPNYKAH